MSDATERLTAMLASVPTFTDPKAAATYLEGIIEELRPMPPAPAAEPMEAAEPEPPSEPPSAPETSPSPPEAPPPAPEKPPEAPPAESPSEAAPPVDLKHVHTLLIDAKERLSVNALGDVATFIDRAIQLLEV